MLEVVGHLEGEQRGIQLVLPIRSPEEEKKTSDCSRAIVVRCELLPHTEVRIGHKGNQAGDHDDQKSEARRQTRHGAQPSRLAVLGEVVPSADLEQVHPIEHPMPAGVDVALSHDLVFELQAELVPSLHGECAAGAPCRLMQHVHHVLLLAPRASQLPDEHLHVLLCQTSVEAVTTNQLVQPLEGRRMRGRHRQIPSSASRCWCRRHPHFDIPIHHRAQLRKK
mmetsp:Transcript_157910/g.506452  ORF Transcript_157910/g.506452 Transcript_157910/m.506452 type:complete len:223 (+) Transcript_157910:846-1514(+)